MPRIYKELQDALDPDPAINILSFFIYIYIYFLNHLRVSRDFRVFFLNVLEFFYITTV